MKEKQPTRAVVVAWVRAREHEGATRLEAMRAFGLSDGGPISGKLSTAHRDGLLARLAETRSGFSVYVGPEHVKGRRTKAHGRNAPCPIVGRRRYDPDETTRTGASDDQPSDHTVAQVAEAWGVHPRTGLPLAGRGPSDRGHGLRPRYDARRPARALRPLDLGAATMSGPRWRNARGSGYTLGDTGVQVPGLTTLLAHLEGDVGGLMGWAVNETTQAAMDTRDDWSPLATAADQAQTIKARAKARMTLARDTGTATHNAIERLAAATTKASGPHCPQGLPPLGAALRQDLPGVGAGVPAHRAGL